jgi:prevent-host-death family protein
MASTFKARCLAMLAQRAIDHVQIIVTQRGRPVARVVPIDEVPSGRSTRGSVHLVAEGDEPYYSTGADWEAGG